MVFIGLVLEYVDPEIALRKLIETLSGKGILSIVIQKSNLATFVSKTKYKSLEKLSEISNAVNEEKLDIFLKSKNMELIKREEIILTENKSFLTLDYRLKENI